MLQICAESIHFANTRIYKLHDGQDKFYTEEGNRSYPSNFYNQCRKQREESNG